MIKPEFDATYLIELCSGEQRRWRFLGQDSKGVAWWRDLETSLEFNEGSLMYAWSIVERLDVNGIQPEP
jgi:hypothetical protein